MTQLGFTFYPKDWWASDSFYALNPFERYIYLELLFMMYVNDGFVSNNRVNAERRLHTTIKEDVWLKITDLMVKDGDQLTHRSVNARLRKTLVNRENGKLGGRPRKDENNPKNPTYKPKLKPNHNPPSEKNRIEKEEEEENDSPSPTYANSIIKGIDELRRDCLRDHVNFVEHICRQNKVSAESIPKALDDFNAHLRSTNITMKGVVDYRNHFQNWFRKQKTQNTGGMVI